MFGGPVALIGPRGRRDARLRADAGATGFSAYVGDGTNRWPAVHRGDAARVFRLVIERGGPGEVFHAVAEEGVRFRRIAEAIGVRAGVPARSIAVDRAADHFGALAKWAGGHGPASSAWTRAALGWAPTRAGLIEDIGRPDHARSSIVEDGRDAG